MFFQYSFVLIMVILMRQILQSRMCAMPVRATKSKVCMINSCLWYLDIYGQYRIVHGSTWCGFSRDLQQQKIFWQNWFVIKVEEIYPFLLQVKVLVESKCTSNSTYAFMAFLSSGVTLLSMTKCRSWYLSINVSSYSLCSSEGTLSCPSWEVP